MIRVFLWNILRIVVLQVSSSFVVLFLTLIQAFDLCLTHPLILPFTRSIDVPPTHPQMNHSRLTHSLITPPPPPPPSLFSSGIECPIIPGMMPIQSYPSFVKMTQYGKSRVPDKIWQDLNPIKDNDAAVKDYGTNLCTLSILFMMHPFI